MTYAELNLYGVYFAPIAPMIFAAWVLFIAIRSLADRLGLLRHVWHPALFLYCAYVMLLSVVVLLVGRIGL
jgi:hypothetical protein